jgi:hypothetical protein
MLDPRIWMGRFQHRRFAFGRRPQAAPENKPHKGPTSRAF